jgi:hypothetical protein
MDDTALLSVHLTHDSYYVLHKRTQVQKVETESIRVVKATIAFLAGYNITPKIIQTDDGRWSIRWQEKLLYPELTDLM